MPIINFNLKHPDQIVPWGVAPDLNLHWFGLSDGEYWMELNDTKIYEYKIQTKGKFEIKENQIVSYYIQRLVEDLSELFGDICEPLCNEFYSMVKTHDGLYAYLHQVKEWFNQFSEENSDFLDVAFDQYCNMLKWVENRTLRSSHLISGPVVSFLRLKDRLSVVWDASTLNDEGELMWTTQKGEIEISYSSFVAEVEDFGYRFFAAMETQIEIACAKDWGKIAVDKDALAKEQESRKSDFFKQVKKLKQVNVSNSTDWKAITSMVKEIIT